MMELGGNSPVIICKDCNLNLAVKIVIDGCFKYSVKDVRLQEE